MTTTQRPYWKVDGQIGLATRNDAVELSLFVRNLFDVRPLTGALGLPDFGLAEYIFGQERRIGLALTGRFWWRLYFPVVLRTIATAFQARRSPR